MESVKSKFVTVKKNNPDFKKLLDGTYSKDHRSIPLEPLNASVNEIVTFELIPLHQIKKQSWLKLTYDTLKPQYFLIVLVPILFCFLEAYRSTGVFLFREFYLILASLFSLSVYVNIQRTLVEHDTGATIFASAPTSNILKSGQCTAFQLNLISKIFLFFGIMISLPMLVKGGLILFSLILTTGVLLLFINRKANFGQNFLLFLISAFSHFLVAGPLLTVGASLVLNQSLNKSMLFFGVSWGLWVLLFRQLRSFKKIYSFSKLQNSRFASSIGFDKMIAVLQKSIIIVPLFSTAVLALISEGWIFCFINALVHSFFIVKELLILNKIQSTFASASEDLSVIANQHHYTLVVSHLIAFCFL